MKANKGDYVVLLTGSNGGDTWKSSIPINHVYKLRADADVYNFFIEKDVRGSTSNGWNGCGLNGKLTFRPATQREIETYNKNNRPCKLEKEDIYEIY